MACTLRHFMTMHTLVFVWAFQFFVHVNFFPPRITTRSVSLVREDVCMNQNFQALARPNPLQNLKFEPRLSQSCLFFRSLWVRPDQNQCLKNMSIFLNQHYSTIKIIFKEHCILISGKRCNVQHFSICS